MANFDTALAKTLDHEGGFSLNETTGECVNCGITAWFLRSIGVLHGTGPASPNEISFVKAIDRNYAAELYREHFWDANRIGEISDQGLADKVFDLCVNHGPGGTRNGHIVKGGITMLQMAVNILAGFQMLKVDGVIGPKTLWAVNSMAAVNVLAVYRALAGQNYLEIASANPVHAPDLPGWLVRLAS